MAKYARMKRTSKLIDDSNNSYQGSFTSPVGSIPSTDVFGKGGSIRHTGSFSDNNPWVNQMLVSSNNQDKDAAYEGAVKWEVDNANYERERADKRADLEEQRAYDDPSAAIARQRAAGINPDLSGSSGGSSSGGSSATVAPTEMNQQQLQTKFKNSYDTTDRVIAGINSASSLISSIGGFAQSFASVKSALSLLPSQQRISESEADVAERTADARVKIANATSEGASLQNVSSRLNFLGQLAGYTSPDSSDDDVSAMLGTMGVPESERANLLKSLRHYQQNPQMQADYAAAQLRMKVNFAENESYSYEVMKNIMSNKAQTDQLTAQADFFAAQLNESIQSYLAQSDYAQNTATSLEKQALTSVAEDDLNYQKIMRDAQAFGAQLDYIASLQRETEKLIAESKPVSDTSLAKARHRAYVESLRLKAVGLSQLGSEYLSQAQTIAQGIYQSQYVHNDTRIGLRGGAFGSEKHKSFMSALWSDIIDTSDPAVEVGQNLVSTIVSLFGKKPRSTTYNINVPKSH